jgi:hypothetical protein
MEKAEFFANFKDTRKAAEKFTHKKQGRKLLSKILKDENYSTHFLHFLSTAFDI